MTDMHLMNALNYARSVDFDDSDMEFGWHGASPDEWIEIFEGEIERRKEEGTWGIPNLNPQKL